MNTTNNTPRTKPVHEVRFGGVKAAIWRNEGEHGIRYNTTFTRVYRDGEQWKNTESFGRDDLLLLAKAANDAHTWIHQQARESANENSTTTTSTSSSSGSNPRFNGGSNSGGFPRTRASRPDPDH